ncbi:MAG: hypothetical protein AAGU74_05730 [Bacillota bacterium]
MDQQEKAKVVAFAKERFRGLGDYDFLPSMDLDAMIDAFVSMDAEYMREAGVDQGGVYDDEAAFDRLFAGMKERFNQYQMYLMRMTEDYMDIFEEYLDSIDAIEWV